MLDIVIGYGLGLVVGVTPFVVYDWLRIRKARRAIRDLADIWRTHA